MIVTNVREEFCVRCGQGVMQHATWRIFKGQFICGPCSQPGQLLKWIDELHEKASQSVHSIEDLQLLIDIHDSLSHRTPHLLGPDVTDRLEKRLGKK